MLKKSALFAVAMFVAVLLLAGCGSSSKVKLIEGKVNVVTSFYPLYDFTKQIGGEYVNVINLVPAGVEPHEWTPKSGDLTALTKAQLFVYHGAGFEGWVQDFIDSLKKDAVVKPVEASAGVAFIPLTEEQKAEEEAEHKDGKQPADEHEGEFDPHTWLSPKNAIILSGNIKKALIEKDPAHQAAYEANYKAFSEKLVQLDATYQTELAKTTKKDIVTSHQAFGYLAKDYGLKQLAIMGLSPDAEPTAQDLKNINQFVRDNHVTYIFFEELVSDKLAKTLAKDAGAQTLVLNPLEGLTQEEADAGQNYVTVMEQNLKNLLKALQ